MKKRVITEDMLCDFTRHLEENEKSKATIEKYLHDVRYFMRYAGAREADKSLSIEYKAHLKKEYAVSSANSMLAAMNSFFKFKGWHDCCVKRFRVQRATYCPEEKELTRAEYFRLINAAKSKGDKRLDLIIQTIGSTGMRVSELHFITVEAVERGEAIVSCKGRTRTVFIVSKLRKNLLQYIKSKGLEGGPVFISRSGRPLNRSNIWREMKKLCEASGVMESKVFPHNLRHLFARMFYAMEKDIAKLADILGHASIDTTRIYIIATGKEHRQRVEALKLIL